VAAAARQAAARGVTAIGVIVVAESPKRRWLNKADRMLEERSPSPAKERISGVRNDC
jgi:phosphoribosylanthranilate isomerase